MLLRYRLLTAGTVCAMLAPIASADVLTSSSSHASDLVPKTAPDRGTRNALTDLFGAEVTIFSDAGGAYLADDPDVGDPELAVFGTPTSIGNNFQDRAVIIDSSQTVVSPTEYVYQVTWEMADGGPFFPEGTTLGGVPVTTIGFELGEANAIPDPIDGVGGTITGILDPLDDGGTPGDPSDDRYQSTLDLYDSAGDLLFSGNFFTALDSSGGVTGVTYLNAGGADLSTLDIASATVNISVGFEPIPEPSTAAVLGLAGLTLLRRRR